MAVDLSEAVKKIRKWRQSIISKIRIPDSRRNSAFIEKQSGCDWRYHYYFALPDDDFCG